MGDTGYVPSPNPGTDPFYSGFGGFFRSLFGMQPSAQYLAHSAALAADPTVRMLAAQSPAFAAEISRRLGLPLTATDMPNSAPDAAAGLRAPSAPNQVPAGFSPYGPYDPFTQAKYLDVATQAALRGNQARYQGGLADLIDAAMGRGGGGLPAGGLPGGPGMVSGTAGATAPAPTRIGGPVGGIGGPAGMTVAGLPVSGMRLGPFELTNPAFKPPVRLGTGETATGLPPGQPTITTQTVRTRTMKEAVPQVLDSIKNVELDMKDASIFPGGDTLQRGMLWAGFNDPSYLKYVNDVDLVTSRLAQMHVGNQGAQRTVERFSNMLSQGINNRTNMAAALDGIKRYAKDIANGPVGSPYTDPTADESATTTPGSATTTTTLPAGGGPTIDPNVKAWADQANALNKSLMGAAPKRIGKR